MTWSSSSPPAWRCCLPFGGAATSFARSLRDEPRLCHLDRNGPRVRDRPLIAFFGGRGPRAREPAQALAGSISGFSAARWRLTALVTRCRTPETRPQGLRNLGQLLAFIARVRTECRTPRRPHLFSFQDSPHLERFSTVTPEDAVAFPAHIRQFQHISLFKALRESPRTRISTKHAKCRDYHRTSFPSIVTRNKCREKSCDEGLVVKMKS